MKQGKKGDGGAVPAKRDATASAQWKLEMPHASAPTMKADVDVEHDVEPVAAKQTIHRAEKTVFRTAKGNQKDTGVVSDANALISAGKAKDMEDALDQLYKSSSGEQRNKVKATQKAFGFRASRSG